MIITYEHLPQAIQALKQCAREHEKEYVPTAHVRTTDLCKDAACFLQSIIDEKEFRNERQYDSSKDTLLHIKRVNTLILQFLQELINRAITHDESKLHDPEKPLFDKMTPWLKDLTYGSEEYKQSLAELKPALDHHYTHNSHHPEYYENGIDDFTLADLVEMFFDWKAASERHNDGDILKSIEVNKQRFGLSDQLCKIFENTERRLYTKNTINQKDSHE